MASTFSDYLEAAVLNHFFRNVSTSSPATVYMALFTVAPSDAGGGTEVSGGSYTRVAVSFGAPSGGVITQNADCTFPTASGSLGTIVAWAIFDASSGGNQLADGAITPNQSIVSGQQPVIPSGTATITLT